MLIPLILLALLAGSLAACGSRDESSGPTVTATTGIVADITERVAGEDVNVDQVIPDGSSPHDFQLSAEDRAEIDDSILLVSNGADLEAGIPIDEIDVPKFALADHVGRLRPSDPHVWMDPSRVAAALPALAEALAKADPDHAAGYRQRAKAFAAELTALDAEIQQALEAIPPPDRKLVTSHNALGYFADRYGLEVLPTPFPASGAEAEASARTINEVEEAIVRSGVRTVFAQETDDPEVLRGIAEDTGVHIEEHLLVEAPGDAGSYVEMLRRDAELIREGLAPSG